MLMTICKHIYGFLDLQYIGLALTENGKKMKNMEEVPCLMPQV